MAKTITLFCAAGMSTSLLVNKMKEAAAAKGADYDIAAYSLGELIYFFEKACGISGYLLAVNPFNQPGVEAYKKNMFALLGKPGYEDQKAALEARLNK